MAFVRGESSDTDVKGDKYMWAPAPDTQTTAMRGLKREADDDAYFDEDDENGSEAGVGADVDDDDPLEAYMCELEGKPAPSKKPKRAPPKPAPPPPKPAAPAAEEEEEDPLDAYMAGLAKQPAPAAAAPAKPGRVTKQLDEQEDHVVDFMEQQEAELAEQAEQGEGEGGEGEAGGASAMRRQLKDQKGRVELLPAVELDGGLSLRPGLGRGSAAWGTGQCPASLG